MAKGGGTVRTAVFGGAVGAVAGLLVIFVGIMSMLVGAKAEQKENSAEQRYQLSFLMRARDDWTSKVTDNDHVRGGIAVIQARVDDFDGAKQSIEKVTKLEKDIIADVAVYDYLWHKGFAKLEKPKQEEVDRAHKFASSIQNPLYKADALRRVAEAQILIDPEKAKPILREALAAVDASPKVPEPPPPTFNWLVLLWPVGLFVFGFVLVACLKPVIAGLAPPRGKVVAAEEEEEEEEEKEEEEKAKENVAAQAEAEAVATAEAVPADVMPAEAVPADVVPMEAVAEPVGSEMALGAPPPAPPSQLARAGAEAAAPAASADPKKTMVGRTGPAQPTMLARSGPAQPTMLAKQGPATPTQLAQEGALPTKVADAKEALPLPNLPPGGKTQKK
jgi:hypothetical protein